MSIDPLAEKYPYNGVYNFSENRVVDGRELEGLEVVLVKDVPKNQAIIKTANNGGYADDPKTKTIHVFAHGTPSMIYNDNGTSKATQQLNTGQRLDKVLTQSSELWANSESHEGFTVVIHSCRTGKETTDKDGNKVESVAQKISGSDEMKGVNIIAPDERDYFSSEGKELGPYQTTNTDCNTGNPLPGKKHEDLKRINDKQGNWNIFSDGSQTDQYDGDWTPKANPTIWDKIFDKN